jgi:hypothetical protein
MERPPKDGDELEDENGKLLATLEGDAELQEPDISHPYYSAYALDAQGQSCQVQWHCFADWYAKQVDGEDLKNENEACDWEDFYIIAMDDLVEPN